MTDEFQIATVDLREEEFETMKELQGLVKDVRDHFIKEHPEMNIGSLLLSESQQKRLRFERYLKGVPEKQIKQNYIQSVCGIKVVISKYESGCPGCGNEVHWE